MGVLLRGPSGAGKSDLALRLIDGGARLVADDQVEIELEGGRLALRPPATIAGLMEVRGLGIVKTEYAAPATLALVIDLVAGDMVERMPEDETVDMLGQAVPHLALDPWEVSAAAKVRLAVRSITGNIMPVR